jgi:glycine/D-amino acid oxidase-like deaminating enzyme
MTPRMRALRLGRPVWSAASADAVSYPHLRGRHAAEVVVVGGGFTGAAVALAFAEAGVGVMLLEGARVGRGSTAASTALLLREPDQPFAEHTRRYGARRARRIWELGAEGVEEITRTIRAHRVACDLAETDSVQLTLRPEAERPFRADLRLRQRAELAGEWLGPGELRRLTGIAARGAIRTPNAQMDPCRACLGLVDAAARAGAAVHERSPVRRIEQTRSGVRVRTARGVVAAARVVIATGYATPAFKPLAGRFRLSHTYVLATPPIGRAQRRDLGLGDVMLWDTEEPYHYARWTRDRRLLLGGGDRPPVSGRAREAAFRAGTQAVRDYFERLLPALVEIGIEFAWEGVFATTPDGLPYIGAHRRYPRHLFALGYGGNGMTYGALAARLLLEQHRGVVTPDHALFAFGRFR